MKKQASEMLRSAGRIAVLSSIIIGMNSANAEEVTANEAYVGDSETKIVRDGFGGCVRTSSWGEQTMIPSCEGIGDADGDGVLDNVDECPGTPSGVAVDSKGCAIDSDGDGVPDYKDKCPGTPAGTSVDENGCALDSDGDGVPDYKDKCPGTPAGTAVDNVGCEVVALPPQIIEKVVLEDVLFDLNKATLRGSSEAVLDIVANKLTSNPNIAAVKIVGHTDSTGEASYNQMLSEKRANAVRTYLIKKGVNPNMISAVGMGESKPVADNKTREGRKLNRRVVMHVQMK